MKIAGITLILVGVVFFLKNTGIITATIDWSIIWPVLVIILGFALKHNRHGMMCGMGGKCGMCKVGGESHVCEGPNCKH